VPNDCDCQKLRASKLEVVALYRKSLDKDLYDITYGNYIHPYRPEAREAMKEAYDYNDEDNDDYDDDDDEDEDNDYANDGTMQSSVNYHNKRDPNTGRFIKS
jgi:predicted nucleotidyltransferase component of viral defense system